MARPLSDQKRSAILEAATRAIVRDGLSATTAGIAKEAGVANGSLFTYFETKTDLFNQLYLELKSEMATAAMEGVRQDSELRERSFQIWQNWTHWAVAFPAKRRALTQLSASGELAPETVAAGHKLMSGLASLVDHLREKGSLRKAPLAFVIALMNAIADATMEFMAADPSHAKKHCKKGFDAFWRMLE